MSQVRQNYKLLGFLRSTATSSIVLPSALVSSPIIYKIGHLCCEDIRVHTAIIYSDGINKNYTRAWLDKYSATKHMIIPRFPVHSGRCLNTYTSPPLALTAAFVTNLQSARLSNNSVTLGNPFRHKSIFSGCHPLYNFHFTVA